MFALDLKHHVLVLIILIIIHFENLKHRRHMGIDTITIPKLKNVGHQRRQHCQFGSKKDLTTYLPKAKYTSYWFYNLIKS